MSFKDAHDLIVSPAHKFDLVVLQARIEVENLDLTDLANVKRCAEALMKLDCIDALILNAGLMACPQEYTQHGFERQMGMSSMGHKSTAMKSETRSQFCHLYPDACILFVSRHPTSFLRHELWGFHSRPLDLASPRKYCKVHLGK